MHLWVNLLNFVLILLLFLEYFQPHQFQNSTSGIDTLFVGSPAVGLRSSRQKPGEECGRYGALYPHGPCTDDRTCQ